MAELGIKCSGNWSWSFHNINDLRIYKMEIQSTAKYDNDDAKVNPSHIVKQWQTTK